MKLSEKGFEKILDTCHFDEDRATYALNYSWPKKDYHFEIQGTEFKQDDFQDMVILTIEEAKQVKTFLDDAIKLHDKGIVVIQSTGFDTVQLIKERISKAEGK